MLSHHALNAPVNGVRYLATEARVACEGLLATGAVFWSC